MFTEAMELLSAGWLEGKADKKYIWIGSHPSEYRGAQFLFAYMLHSKIYIDGFVTDVPSLVGLKMYHKKIMDINVMDQNGTVVLYDPIMGNCQESVAEDIGVYARNIHPEMDKENVVIWGAGVTGEWAWKILSRNGINVSYFVDSNEKLAGTSKCGLPVFTPDKIKESVTVVEALENWKQLDEEIGEKFGKRFYFSLKKPSMQFECNTGARNKEIFDLTNFWSFNFFEGKNIYIFGNGCLEKEFIEYLSLLDYNCAGFLVEEMDNGNERNCDRYPVRYVEEIIYESNFYIWMYGKEKAYWLEKLGLRQYTDYMCHVGYVGISRKRKDCLDVNLGYNYSAEGIRYPGIMVYGAERKENYKIAVLGGSTSDGAMYPFKSWPELLYEELECDNLTIYNAGVCGYKSGQELIRLVRDILPLKPYMVIVFDGYNDTWGSPKYPFAFGYVQKVFNYAKDYVEDLCTGERYDDVCLGSVAGNDLAENWLSNLRSMYAIARDRKIKFYGFCQPMLASKEGKTIKEKNMLLSLPSSYLEREINGSLRKRLEQMERLPDYLHDLSHIFDNTEDIYMDEIHVWEEGNRIIAKEIGKIILPEMKKIFL